MVKNKMFKPLDECIKLQKAGVESDTGYEYVCNCIETSFDVFDINGDIEAQLKELADPNDWNIKVQEIDDEYFDEFTSVICSAYRL